MRLGPIPCRTPDQSVVCGYVDHDGAVSFAAILRPRAADGCDRAHGCPVLLSLHGTSIPVRDSADAFKRKPRGAAEGAAYRFGVERYWVVAPTRHGAHNWEDGGARSAIAAVDAIGSPSRGGGSLPCDAKVDTRRVFFTGHSMGGHGAWLGALQSADRAIGVASVSGWTDKGTYGESNAVFDQSASDVSASYVDPALAAVLRAAQHDNSVEYHLRTLAGVPHLARAGADDGTVHPFFARRAARILAAAEGGGGGGGDGGAAYIELPGKQHWWWDTERANDGGAMNDDQMRAAFARAAGAANARPELPPIPPEYTLTASNPASFAGRGGWRLVQARRAGRPAALRFGPRSDGSVELGSTNLRRLAAPRSELRALPEGSTLDGQSVRALVDAAGGGGGGGGGGTISLCRLRGGRAWEAGDAACGGASWGEAERRPETGGPIKQVIQSRARIVVGGGERGGDGGGAMGRQLAALGTYLANLFVLTSDASPPLDLDYDLDLDRDLDGDLDGGADEGGGGNLILLGSPRHNNATRRLAAYWARVGHAFGWADGADGAERMVVGGCALPADGVGALVLGPREGGGLALVVSGDVGGVRDALSVAQPTIPPMARAPFSSLLPDFLVTGPDFAARGYGGALAAGFFGHDWSLDAGKATWWMGPDCEPLEAVA